MTASESTEPTLAPEQVRTIAARQKRIMVCILVYLVVTSLAMAARSSLPPELHPIVMVGLMVLGVILAGFTSMLTTELYGMAKMILLTIVMLIPFIGVIALLVVNGKATRILRDHGIRVGLMGAKASDLWKAP